MNKRTEHLRTNFYDRRGNFLRAKYDQSDYHLDRKKFNHLKLWVSCVCVCVLELTILYSNMFLISQSKKKKFRLKIYCQLSMN